MSYISNSIMEKALEEIACELREIRVILQALAPMPVLPNPPSKPYGKESISYVSEESLWAQEQEELRQIHRGLIPSLNEESED